MKSPTGVTPDSHSKPPRDQQGLSPVAAHRGCPEAHFQSLCWFILSGRSSTCPQSGRSPPLPLPTGQVVPAASFPSASVLSPGKRRHPDRCLEGCFEGKRRYWSEGPEDAWRRQALPAGGRRGPSACVGLGGGLLSLWHGLPVSRGVDPPLFFDQTGDAFYGGPHPFMMCVLTVLTRRQGSGEEWWFAQGSELLDRMM